MKWRRILSFLLPLLCAGMLASCGTSSQSASSSNSTPSVSSSQILYTINNGTASTYNVDVNALTFTPVEQPVTSFRMVRWCSSFQRLMTTFCTCCGPTAQVSSIFPCSQLTVRVFHRPRSADCGCAFALSIQHSSQRALRIHDASR